MGRAALRESPDVRVRAAAEGVKTCACSGGCPGLAALALRVAALEARGSSRLARGDVDRLARLLPVVAAVFGPNNFLVRELLRADAPGLRLVLGSCSAKSVGRLLRRAEGVPVNGLVVGRVGSDAGSVLWQILKVVC